MIHNSATPANPSAPLRSRRCVRHDAREAAARCPSCGNFFCRECVIEHEGQLRCADCLARQTAAAAAAQIKPKKHRGRYLRWLRFAASVLVLWLLFYWAGWLLLQSPPEMHDSKLWGKWAD